MPSLKDMKENADGVKDYGVDLSSDLEDIIYTIGEAHGNIQDAINQIKENPVDLEEAADSMSDACAFLRSARDELDGIL